MKLLSDKKTFFFYFFLWDNTVSAFATDWVHHRLLPMSWGFGVEFFYDFGKLTWLRLRKLRQARRYLFVFLLVKQKTKETIKLSFSQL
jgi:hypothetical protein